MNDTNKPEESAAETLSRLAPDLSKDGAAVVLRVAEERAIPVELLLAEIITEGVEQLVRKQRKGKGTKPRRR